jgi:hypothetical protein
MKNRIGTTLVSILRSVFLCSTGSTSMSRLFLYASYVSSRRDEVSDATVGDGCTASISLSMEDIVPDLRQMVVATSLKRRHGNLLNNTQTRMRNRHSFSGTLLHRSRVDKYRSSTSYHSFRAATHAILRVETTECPRSAVPRSWSLSRKGAKGLLTAASLAWRD